MVEVVPEATELQPYVTVERAVAWKALKKSFVAAVERHRQFPRQAVYSELHEFQLVAPYVAA